MADVEIATIITQGVAASRPAAADALEYYATDTKVRSWSNGTSWSDQLPGLVTFHGAKAYNNATQTINNTVAAIGLNTEEFDSDAYHDTSTNNTRMTVPTGLGGKYLLMGGGFWSASGSWLGFRLNNTSDIRGYHTSAGGVYAQVMAIVALAAGDYVEMRGTSTANVTIGHATLPDAQSWFSMVLIGV